MSGGGGSGGGKGKYYFRQGKVFRRRRSAKLAIGAVLALEPILAMIRTIPPASAFAAAAIATRSALPCRPLVRSS